MEHVPTSKAVTLVNIVTALLTHDRRNGPFAGLPARTAPAMERAAVELAQMNFAFWQQVCDCLSSCCKDALPTHVWQRQPSHTPLSPLRRTTDNVVVGAPLEQLGPERPSERQLLLPSAQTIVGLPVQTIETESQFRMTNVDMPTGEFAIPAISQGMVLGASPATFTVTQVC